MSQKTLEWKVGLFVFGCLVVLGLLMVYFSKGMTFFKPTYTLRLNSKSVGGIKPQAAVLMAGVQIGNVTRAELAEDGRTVTVFLKFDAKYKIHGDAVFSIDSMGFLGDQYIMITPGKNEVGVLQDNDEVTCREPFNLQEVARSALGFIHRIDETARKLDDALTRVDRSLLNEESLTNLAAAFGNLRLVSDRALTAADRIDWLVQSNALGVNTAVSNLVLFSLRLNDLSTSFERLLSTNEADITTAVKNIESASDLMKGLLTDIRAGKGLAGSLFNDQQLEAGFSQIVSNLSALSSNLNRYGLLWKPKRSEARPPSPLYPGRDP